MRMGCSTWMSKGFRDQTPSSLHARSTSGEPDRSLGAPPVRGASLWGAPTADRPRCLFKPTASRRLNGSGLSVPIPLTPRVGPSPQRGGPQSRLPGSARAASPGAWRSPAPRALGRPAEWTLLGDVRCPCLNKCPRYRRSGSQCSEPRSLLER